MFFVGGQEAKVRVLKNSRPIKKKEERKDVPVSRKQEDDGEDSDQISFLDEEAKQIREWI